MNLPPRLTGGVVDPGVPGTAVFTDTDALAELLATADETLLRRPYLRWKPGTSCVAALELASGPAYAAAFSDAAGAKLAKTLEQAPAGSVLLVDRRLCVLVARPSADRDLPALRDLAGAFARAMGGGATDPSDAVETLAYKPFRRWVGTLSSGRAADPGDRGRYVVRAYRPGDLERARANLKAARRLFGGLAPEPLARSRRRGLIVQAWAPGETLDRALTTRSDLADTLPTVGRTLAGVHQRHPPSTATRRAAASLGAAAELLGALDEELGRWAASLAARLESVRPSQGDDPVFVHGDFSVDQVVLGPDGLVFLDWDRAGADAPVVDLAGMRAAGLDVQSWQRVLDGYREVRPLPRDLDWHVAAAMLERAPEPFRAGHRNWHGKTRRVLADVQQLLG